jgi:hypothetical protein
MKSKDITNKKFGRLTALKFIKRGNYSQQFWLYKCDCGKERILMKISVSFGNTKSCGCLQKERTSKANKVHGDTKTRFHNIWCGMRNRCENKHNWEYPHYGAKGIIVCKRWSDYLKFKTDMHKSYLKHCKEFGEKDTTIDRINTKGNYCKKNCRWATQKVQQNNRSNNR